MRNENPGVEREDWNRRWEEHELHGHDDANRVLAAEVEGSAPGRALDLACGAGRNAVWLGERGWEVTGVDFSDVALAQARERARARGVEVDWVHADLRSYEPSPAAYDLVLVLYLHLRDAERRLVLGRASAALAPGGTLLVMGHDLANIGTGAPGPTNPAVLYTPDDLAAELPGLRIERADRVTRPVETDAGEVEAVDALVRAVRR